MSKGKKSQASLPKDDLQFDNAKKLSKTVSLNDIDENPDLEWNWNKIWKRLKSKDEWFYKKYLHKYIKYNGF